MAVEADVRPAGQRPQRHVRRRYLVHKHSSSPPATARPSDARWPALTVGRRNGRSAPRGCRPGGVRGPASGSQKGCWQRPPDQQSKTLPQMAEKVNCLTTLHIFFLGFVGRKLQVDLLRRMRPIECAKNFWLWRRSRGALADQSAHQTSSPTILRHLCEAGSPPPQGDPRGGSGGRGGAAGGRTGAGTTPWRGSSAGTGDPAFRRHLQPAPSILLGTGLKGRAALQGPGHGPNGGTGGGGRGCREAP